MYPIVTISIIPFQTIFLYKLISFALTFYLKHLNINPIAKIRIKITIIANIVKSAPKFSKILVDLTPSFDKLLGIYNFSVN